MHRVVNAHMAEGIRLATVRRGIEGAVALYEEACLAERATNNPLREEVRVFRAQTLTRQHERMCEALRGARDGIAHLTQTYRDDATLVAQVMLVLREIDDFVDSLVHLKARTSAPALRLPLTCPRGAGASAP